MSVGGQSGPSRGNPPAAAGRRPADTQGRATPSSGISPPNRLAHRVGPGLGHVRRCKSTTIAVGAERHRRHRIVGADKRFADRLVGGHIPPGTHRTRADGCPGAVGARSVAGVGVMGVAPKTRYGSVCSRTIVAFCETRCVGSQGIEGQPGATAVRRSIRHRCRQGPVSAHEAAPRRLTDARFCDEGPATVRTAPVSVLTVGRAWRRRWCTGPLRHATASGGTCAYRLRTLEAEAVTRHRESWWPEQDVVAC